MTPGETRIVNTREWNDGKLGDVTGSVAITRTSRAYAYDLVDAYNARRGASSNDDVAWFVDHAGAPRFGLTPAGERRMREAFLGGGASPTPPTRVRARPFDQEYD